MLGVECITVTLLSIPIQSKNDEKLSGSQFITDLRSFPFFNQIKQQSCMNMINSSLNTNSKNIVEFKNTLWQLNQAI